jgi:hypothetical protein
MKHLLCWAALLAILTGCANNDFDYAGTPDRERVREREIRTQNEAGDNLHDIGRQSSPSHPWSGKGNGSTQF